MGFPLHYSILDEFQRAYAECALWSSIDDAGNPLDDGRDVSDIAPSTIVRMQRDCNAFREAAGSLLDDTEDSQAGRDFWLTRNGHGTGFWDADASEYPNDSHGKSLTEVCRRFPEVNLYVDDDGLVYQD